MGEEIDLGRQVPDIPEEGAPEELHEQGIGILDGAERERLPADRIAVVVRADAAELESPGAVAAAGVEALDDGHLEAVARAVDQAEGAREAQDMLEVSLRLEDREVALGFHGELVVVEVPGQDLAGILEARLRLHALGGEDDAVAGVVDEGGDERHDAVGSLDLPHRQRSASAHAVDVDPVGVERELERHGLVALVERDGGAEPPVVVGLALRVDGVGPGAEAEVVPVDVRLLEVDRVALAACGGGQADAEELAAAGEAGAVEHVLHA